MTRPTQAPAIIKTEAQQRQEFKQAGSALQAVKTDFFINNVSQMAVNNIDAKSVCKALAISISKNDRLAKCSPLSLLNSSMAAVNLGLMPASPLGHAYLVPYKTEAQLIIGYLGLIELSRRSGELKTICAQGVSQEEIETGAFSFSYGTGGGLFHAPILGEKKPVAYYAYAQLSGGAEQYEVLSLKEIKNIQSRSMSARMKDSPWHQHFDAMAKKTAIRRLCKLLPKVTELQDAAQAEDNTADYLAYKGVDPQDLAPPEIEVEAIEEGEEGAVEEEDTSLLESYKSQIDAAADTEGTDRIKNDAREHLNSSQFEKLNNYTTGE